MRLLALETATIAGAVALSVDGKLLGELVTTTSRAHAETLLPAAAALLAEAGLEPAELDAVVVDVGPGLFTGLRVGVATARSMAMAAGIGVVGLTSLEILASDPALDGASSVIALVDARRGEVFAQRFRRSQGAALALGPPAVLSPSALIPWAASGPGAGQAVAVIGDGALRYPEAVDAIGGAVLVDSVKLPSPAVACSLAEGQRRRRRDRREPTAVRPLYLRAPDAVSNFRVAPGGRRT
jgi:tRNA threonylcarbamoyladenosine biosynthesis protein TsaB